MSSGCPEIFEINVGGHIYATTVHVLTQKHPNSTLALLAQSFLAQANSETDKGAGENGKNIFKLMRDGQGRLFIDRDGPAFRLILDYLRLGDTVPVPMWVDQLIPTHSEKFRLKLEADFYGLQELSLELEQLLAAKDAKDIKVGYINILNGFQGESFSPKAHSLGNA